MAATAPVLSSAERVTACGGCATPPRLCSASLQRQVPLVKLPTHLVILGVCFKSCGQDLEGR